MKYSVILFIGIIGLSIFGCSTVFSGMKPVIEKSNVAVYYINAEDYPQSDKLKAQIPKIAKFPPLSVFQIEGILGSLKYRKTALFGITERDVFYKKELKLIAPVIADAVKKAKPNQRIVIVSRFDPDNSVLSHAERVSLLLWADVKGNLNLVFGDIRYEIPYNDYLEYDDWTEISPIDLKTADKHYTLLKSKEYSLKKINGMTHGVWALFPIQELGKYGKSAKKSKFTKYTEQEKKEILREAYEAGLITRAEYEKKLNRTRYKERKAILDKAYKAGLLTKEEYEAKLEKIKGKSQPTPKKEEK